MSPAPGQNPSGRLLDWLERRLNLSEMFSFITHFGIVTTPVDTSLPIREVVREVGASRVELYTSLARSLGLLTALLFGLEVISGVMLAFYYQPTPAAAFESTRGIVRDVPFGWFVHQVHSWGARLLVALVLVRLLRFFWDGLYRAPREVLWMSAVALLWLSLQLEFTGRLLSWSGTAYWSVVRGLEVLRVIPGLGLLLEFVVGRPEVDEGVLLRFYVLHIMVLPLAFAGFVWLTFATLRRVGFWATPVAAPAREAIPYRAHLYNMLIILLLIFAVLVTLSALIPFRFTEAADPFVTPSGTRPPWYLLASRAAVQGLPVPPWIPGLGLLVTGLAMLLLPFIPGTAQPANDRRIRLAGIAACVMWIAFTFAGLWLDRR